MVKRRRGKDQELAGGGGVASDPQLEDPNQMGIAGSEGRDPSVYLAVSRGYWFHGSGYYPLHKVDVASSSDSSSPGAAAASRVANLKTDVGWKTFVTLQSRWIIGVGGDPGGTVIFDTKTGKVISGGPKLVAPKVFPVVAVVGYRIYALSKSLRFIKGPDLVPWFEVLDLSKAMDTEGGLSLLDMCSWEALPLPLFFPSKLTPLDSMTPPIYAVRSYVVVGHYILLTLDEPSNIYEDRLNPEESQEATYAFDTKLEKWQKVGNTVLPFVGRATPHGHSGRIFLGLSRKDRSINAYRISVSTSSGSSTIAGGSDKGGALKLSITVFSVKNKSHEQVGVDTCRGSHKKYYKESGEYYSRRLYAKLKTYQIESKSLALLETPDKEMLGVEPEIAIASQREQSFKIFSGHGFYSDEPIAFILSV
ncbi:unnamed protein product [Urochloa decumbens]|uniref:Uncharacterized protein n=1 Tax=Urochloa decumbens TaxID=240449 RepID=A0ABC9BRH3_9POAL